MFNDGQDYREVLTTPMTSPNAAAAGPRHRGHPPVFALSFHGGPEANATRFLERCEKYFAIAETDDEDKASKAASAFQGEALTWWKGQDKRPGTWDVFTFQLLQRYENLGRKTRLEYEVKSTRQKEGEGLYPFLAGKRDVARVCASNGDQERLAQTIQGLLTPRNQERTNRLQWSTLDELVEAARTLELKTSPEDEELITHSRRRRENSIPRERRIYEETPKRYYDSEAGCYYSEMPASPPRQTMPAVAMPATSAATASAAPTCAHNCAFPWSGMPYLPAGWPYQYGYPPYAPPPTYLPPPVEYALNPVKSPTTATRNTPSASNGRKEATHIPSQRQDRGQTAEQVAEPKPVWPRQGYAPPPNTMHGNRYGDEERRPRAQTMGCWKCGGPHSARKCSKNHHQERRNY